MICLWAYSPGVAEPCLAIAEDKSKVYNYTSKRQFGSGNFQRNSSFGFG
ncbi:hypothetical protein CCAN12_690025 [Capnocytophaga canimorsus]|uniref:Uncharacterized protein n=1 Tax=Capnocytophaga canimorsus TaxID=28188 RepID=A0A0B7HD94_9FLAO|nr:hypothetical protein CCAN12_690025 [Capnocytophaga canimorsus]